VGSSSSSSIAALDKSTPSTTTIHRWQAGAASTDYYYDAKAASANVGLVLDMDDCASEDERDIDRMPHMHTTGAGAGAGAGATGRQGKGQAGGQSNHSHGHNHTHSHSQSSPLASPEAGGAGVPSSVLVARTRSRQHTSDEGDPVTSAHMQHTGTGGGGYKKSQTRAVRTLSSSSSSDYDNHHNHHNHHQHRGKGFCLLAQINVMITVPLIALLAAIALHK
jgi:hypothetical protein